MNTTSYIDEAQDLGAIDLWPTPTEILERVVSAGRSGPESESLRAAQAAGRQVGGVAVRGGPGLPNTYNTLAGNAGEALRLNILNSDATLVVVIGDQDDGDKLLATRIALRMRKPCMTLALPNRRARVSPQTAAQIVAWARSHDVKTLHVTGPSECQEPGLGELTRLAVAALLAAADAQGAAPEGEAEVVDVPELEQRRRADTVPDTAPAHRIAEEIKPGDPVPRSAEMLALMNCDHECHRIASTATVVCPGCRWTTGGPAVTDSRSI